MLPVLMVHDLHSRRGKRIKILEACYEKGTQGNQE